MVERDIVFCPLDGVTPVCEGHPDYCPVRRTSVSNRELTALEGTHVLAKPLPKDIRNKIEQLGAIKTIKG